MKGGRQKATRVPVRGERCEVRQPVQAALNFTRERVCESGKSPFNKNLEAVGGGFDPSLFSYTSVKMSSELATSYAALILTDDNVEITVKYRSYIASSLLRAMRRVVGWTG